MKKVLKVLLILVVIGVLACIGLVVTYFTMIKAPNSNNETVSIVINQGDNYSSIAKLLKDNNLIKNELAYKIYIKLNTPTKSLEAGDYDISNSFNYMSHIFSLKKFNSYSLSMTFSTFFKFFNKFFYT